jgi:hypothetical protein
VLTTHPNGTGLEYFSQQMAKRSQSPRIKPIEGEEVKKGKKFLVESRSQNKSRFGAKKYS